MPNPPIILTQKFFEEPPFSPAPTYITSSACAYDPVRHGQNLETFQKHPDFAAFREHYFQLLDRLAALGNTPAMTVKQQKIFLQSINTFQYQHLFNLSYCDARTHALWNVTREHLEALVEILPTANLSITEKAGLLNELAPNLLVCVDGVISHLQDILKRVSNNQHSVIACAKEILCEQLILEFIRDYHAEQRPAMEVHYVNGLINQLALEFGLARRSHEQMVTSQNPLIQGSYPACRGYLLNKLPFALISYLTEQLRGAAEQALQIDATNPWRPFFEQLIAQFFDNSGLVHVLFSDSGKENPCLSIATELLSLQIADVCQRQGWLQLPDRQLLAQLPSGGYLYGLVTPQPWIWWQPWPEAPYETWKLPKAAQRLEHLQCSSPCQPLWHFACQQLISTDIDHYLQLLSTKPSMLSDINPQTNHLLYQALSHAKFIPSDFQLALFGTQALLQFFFRYPQTALRLLQYRQLCLFWQQDIPTFVTPEIVLSNLLNSQKSKLPETLLLALIDQSVNLNIQDARGSFLLIRAIADNQLKVVKRLLQFHELDINYQHPQNGQSALIAAVLAIPYHPELVDALLRCPKIKLEIKDNSGNCAIDYARLRNNQLAINALENHQPSALPLSIPVLINRISSFIQQETLSRPLCPLMQQLRSFWLYWHSLN